MLQESTCAWRRNFAFHLFDELFIVVDLLFYPLEFPGAEPPLLSGHGLHLALEILLPPFPGFEFLDSEEDSFFIHVTTLAGPTKRTKWSFGNSSAFFYF